MATRESKRLIWSKAIVSAWPYSVRACDWLDRGRLHIGDTKNRSKNMWIINHVSIKWVRSVRWSKCKHNHMQSECIVVDQRCRGSKGKAKIEGYISISDEEAHHCMLRIAIPFLKFWWIGWSCEIWCFFEWVFKAGGEAIISTIGYIAKDRGTDCQMSDIWHIWSQSLTIFVQGNFVLIDCVLGLQYNVVVRCIGRCRCRLSNRLGHSGTKESLVYFVIPFWCWNWRLYNPRHFWGPWCYHGSIHKVFEVHHQGLWWLLVTLSMV